MIAQEAQPPPQQVSPEQAELPVQAMSPEQLANLLAPFALYPGSLLSQYSVMQYETALKTDKFLSMVHGTAEVEKALSQAHGRSSGHKIAAPIADR